MLLLPRHGVMLQAIDGDGPAFVARFRATWRRLPLYARRGILRHWREPERANVAPGVAEYLRAMVAHRGGPLIWLVDTWTSRSRDGAIRDDLYLMAEVREVGIQLHFHGEAFAAMPANVAEDVIAHELAHVLQYALRGTEINQWPPDEVETEADDYITDWGFDPESPDRWARATGRVKIIDISDRPPDEQRALMLDRLLRDGRC